MPAVKRERLPSGRIGKSTGICVPSSICKHPINFFNILKDLVAFVCSAGRLLTWYAEPWGLTEQPAILPSQSKAVHPSHTIRMFSHHKSSHAFTPIYPSPIFTRSPGQIKEVSDENTAVPPSSVQAVRFKLGSQVDRSTGQPELRTPRYTEPRSWCDPYDVMSMWSMMCHWHSYPPMVTYRILWNPMDLSMDLCLNFAFRLSQLTSLKEESLCRAREQPTHLVVCAWKSLKQTCHSQV